MPDEMTSPGAARLDAPPQLAQAAGHFDAAYATDEDPWSVRTSWYERRKRDLLLASLPSERYRNVWEPACSIGLITVELAKRCDRLESSDVSSIAVEAAQQGTSGLSNVRVRVARLPDDPAPYEPGECDLVVLSEVLYYLDEPNRIAAVDLAASLLAPNGHLVVVHFREHPFDAHCSGEQGNREVVDRIGAPLVHHLDEGFVLDVVGVD